MTDEAINTLANEWQRRLRTFTALNLLYQADDKSGPLHRATFLESNPQFACIREPELSSQTHREAKRAQVRADYEAELQRHIASIYEPLIAAGTALIRTPAPDLSAVRTKHEVLVGDVDVISYEDCDSEFFNIIRNDVARLTGVRG
jgi:hypothetical protein